MSKAATMLLTAIAELLFTVWAGATALYFNNSFAYGAAIVVTIAGMVFIGCVLFSIAIDATEKKGTLDWWPWGIEDND
jgi:hypothetical protein